MLTRATEACRLLGLQSIPGNAACGGNLFFSWHLMLLPPLPLRVACLSHLTSTTTTKLVYVIIFLFLPYSDNTATFPLLKGMRKTSRNPPLPNPKRSSRSQAGNFRSEGTHTESHNRVAFPRPGGPPTSVVSPPKTNRKPKQRRNCVV